MIKVTILLKNFYEKEKHLKSYDVPEVDVMLNTVFTNHQFDPMQFIAYCCDRSKKAVFFWSLMDIYIPRPSHSYFSQDHHRMKK